MCRFLFFFGLMFVGITSNLGAAVPGTGTKIVSLSDDFEISWVFNYNDYRKFGGTSSNGIWTSSYRGVPELLGTDANRPAGGVAGQARVLHIRTIDPTSPQDVNDGYPQQEDLITQYHNTLYGRYLVRADQPSIMAHIYMPAYSSILKTYTQPNGTDEYSTLGFRIEARSSQLSSGYYYPSIWLQYYDYGGQNPNNFGIVVRMGDGQASDVYVKNMGSNYPGGWVTVGISFDAAGAGHYYFKEGVSAFTESDKIYDTTQFPGGSNAKMDWIAYNFISIGYPSGDPDLSPDYRIDDISVYIVGPASCADIKAAGLNSKADFTGDCKVKFDDFAILAAQWMGCYDPAFGCSLY